MANKVFTVQLDAGEELQSVTVPTGAQPIGIDLCYGIPSVHFYGDDAQPDQSFGLRLYQDNVDLDASSTPATYVGSCKENESFWHVFSV